MRVRTPTIIQMETTECGAASLGIVLGYFGRYAPLEELRIKCGVSRDGSNALNIIKAAEQYGLKAEGYKTEIEGLEELAYPAILFWGFNHFIVLEGFKGKKIYINDPATGPRVIDYDELDRQYTGIALTFEKLPTFQKGGNPPPLFKSMLKRVSNVKSALVYLTLTSFFLLIPGIALPAFVKVFINQIFIAHMVSWDTGFIISMFFAIALGMVLTWLKRVYLNRLTVKLSIEFSSKFLWHILRLPMLFYSQRYSGEIAYRMRLNNDVASSFTLNFLTAIIDLFLVVFYALLLISYNALLGFLAIGGALINLVVMALISRARRDSYARLQQDIGKSTGVAINALQNIETIKATGSENDFFKTWGGYYAKSLTARQDIGKKDIFLTVVPSAIQTFLQSIVLGIGAYLVIGDKLSVGSLMAFITLMIAFLTPISRFVNFGQQLQTLKIDIARLDDVFKYPIDPVYGNTTTPSENDPLRLNGYIEFKNVTFGYSPLAKPLLNNFSFAIGPGQRLALVGPSGCGKSTISRLAAGLYQPWSGEILLDGKKITDFPREVFNRSVATVDQEIFIFGGSIRDNITLWDPTISEGHLIQACKDACIHEDIMKREQGYDSHLEDQGRNLSGGQRQRLEIARALVRNPSILILDEATSALDSETEQLIVQNILRRGCTCIIVAHRLSTIRDSNQILVLQKGKLVQLGDHFTLKNEPGIYKQLVEKEGI